MKTLIPQLFKLVFLVNLFVPQILYGQWELEGYRNGQQILGAKVERNLLGELEWKDRDTTIYEYDNQQRLLKREHLYFDDTTLVTFSKSFWVYNEDGYVRTDQYWSWEFKEDIHKITEVYNNQNQLVESVEHDWINETWIRFSKEEYYYDELGGIIKIDAFRFVNNDWVLISEQIYEYDAFGNKIYDLLRGFSLAGVVTYEILDKIEKDTIGNQIFTSYWDIYDGELRIYLREIEFLNNENRVDSSYIFWNRFDTLELIRKIGHDYDLTNRLTQSTVFELENHNWEPLLLLNYEYDNNSYLILEKSFLWSEDQNAWNDYIPLQKEYSYTDNGTLIKEVDYTELAIEFEPWIAYERNITYYNNPIIVNTVEITSDFSIQLFPNPTSQFLTINSGEGVSFPLDFKLINLQGQILRQEKLETHLSLIDIGELPNGILLIQFEDKFSNRKTVKVIKH